RYREIKPNLLAILAAFAARESRTYIVHDGVRRAHIAEQTGRETYGRFPEGVIFGRVYPRWHFAAGWIVRTGGGNTVYFDAFAVDCRAFRNAAGEAPARDLRSRP